MKLQFWIVVFLLTLVCFRGVCTGDNISGSADLTYRSTETKTGEEEESAWSFTQNYNLQVTKAFNPKVNFAANLGININETNDTKTTLLTPDIRLNLRNEYFDADTGYRITEKGLDVLTMISDEDRFTTESWNVNFSTKSEKYPKVQLRYNEDINYDHLAVRETDSKTTNFSGTADYTYRFLNFNYEYRNNVLDDYVTEAITETDTHYGRFDFRKSFWKNRISTSGSYSITKTKREIKTGAQDVRNGITHQNIGVDLTSAKEIDQIYLYTTTPDPAFKDNFTWAVYSSSDNSTWTLLKPSETDFDYNTSKKRFEISFTATTARYFKIVNTANDTNNLYVTEIEAYDGTTSIAASDGLYLQDDTPEVSSHLNSEPLLIDGDKTTSAGINIGGYTTQAAFTTTETEQTTQTTQANIRYKPMDWLSFTYDFTQDERETKPDQEESEKTKRRAHSMNCRVERELHKYITAWAQYGRRMEYDSEAEANDKITDTYLLHFLFSPLTTLNTDLSLNHTVSKEDGETESKSSSALLQISAKLREGADLNVDANITRSENLVSQSETTTKSISSDLRLELTRMLTAEIEYDTNWTETQKPEPDGDTTGRTSNARIIFYWRPSHDFYFRGSYDIDRDEKSGEETTQQQYNMNWLMTEKMQLDMGYTLNRNDSVSSTYAANLSWNLSRVFTLRFNYDWSRQKEDMTETTQTFTTNLSARF
ncbi:MAG: discoidin domain-containing protein [Desulfobacterales bacterium]|nr:discoidin domain-containing protein [Desulfobacterales bacterium]